MPSIGRGRLAEESVELGGEAVEDVPARRGELGPGREIADVARGHAERVRHELGQVARALAVEDAGDRGGEEARRCGPRGRATSARTAAGRACPGGTRARPRLGRARPPASASPRAGAGTRRVARVGDDPSREGQPRRGLGVPGEAELGEPGRGGGARRRPDLGRGQQVGERVEVVADPDPALGARLQRRRAATRERIQDDVTGPRVAGDEGVGERGREAREVRAHRVERVAPQALLGLPLGFQRDRRQFERELEGELARGGRARWRSVRSGRHRRVETSLARHVDHRSARWGAEHSTAEFGVPGWSAGRPAG